MNLCEVQLTFPRDHSLPFPEAEESRPCLAVSLSRLPITEDPGFGSLTRPHIHPLEQTSGCLPDSVENIFFPF